MENQFIFDFKNFLYSVQAKPIRIFIQIGISFSLILFGEYGFFNNFNKMQVSGCSEPNDLNSPISLDNCYIENYNVTTCINQIYNSGSNYSLSFTLGTIGIKDDKYSSFLIAISIIFFLLAQGFFQVAHYFQFQKRKRIQDILGNSLIFLDGKKIHEKRLTFYFLIVGICYIITKINWIMYRTNHYNEIDCSGYLYKIQFQGTLSTEIGTLAMSSFPYLIFPLIYIGGWINYLSDLDLKRMTDHLSIESFKEIKNITVFDFKKYNKLIKTTIHRRYPNNSKLNLFFRTNTFSFKTTSTKEIVEILLDYKQISPEEFEPILKFENLKISFITGNDQMKEKLLG
ncbi:hypothetical protein RB653_003829 [Dictyostelium firmibasis]|uniref:Uncharacterized protein n=1 Tax=Dictyostelium firmibasis TaxID=79012 RepID=A0AAN7YXG4_9MYCE